MIAQLSKFDHTRRFSAALSLYGASTLRNDGHVLHLRPCFTDQWLVDRLLLAAGREQQ